MLATFINRLEEGLMALLLAAMTLLTFSQVIARYVFNTGGQHIELHDLLVGCRIIEAQTSEPIVNPVKDSLATKTTPQTNAVAACVYAPMEAVTVDELADLCADFAAWLARCGEAPETGAGVVLPGETCTV